eukprot:CAMPEP_0204911854 /NCGR_PEP_ID=MMETSP1397-20131031/10109_1 /ASSEMBLY_ACC=CAM_ASM_000891 /TAXON_ID=49980 /ORGANISM="Climacostomum Climacostomum virens, Strain Stock W-24" /LENGTH=599 /DNA_ID=CAMNT_0052082561 /DNA_START=70 /DNA_END=1866 /DNA_ORIENTATION=-
MADLKSQYRALAGHLSDLAIVLGLTAYTLIRVIVNTIMFVLSGGRHIRWKSLNITDLTEFHDEQMTNTSRSSSPEEYSIRAEPSDKQIPKTDSRLNLDLLLKSSPFAIKKSWWENSREDIVFVPSQSTDSKELSKIKGVHLYEERQLCMLFRLSEPNIRLVFVSSMPVDPSIIEYYLALMENAGLTTVQNAKTRLLLLSCNDPKLTPLSAKLLRRPQLIKKIKDFIDLNCCYMVPFIASNLERELALTLKIPLTGTDPSLNYWGTKAGGREVFMQAGVPLSKGSGLAYDVSELASKVLKLYLEADKPKTIVIKLNIGFSGKGNAQLPAHKISPEETTDKVVDLIRHEMRYCSDKETWEDFESQLGIYGAIAEVWLENVISSPSAQCSIAVSGAIEVLSTHEQVLDGGSYLGCNFPAKQQYRNTLIDYAKKIGIVLAEKGCLERFSIDFVVSHEDEEYQVYCIEINIRWGGTSHPFITAKYLTKGIVEIDGRLIGADGNEKFYVSSDNVQNDVFIGLNPDDFLELARSDEMLQFNHNTLTGVTFHLISAIPQFGKFGMISIANSRDDACKMQQEGIEELEKLGSSIHSSKIYHELDLSIK